ncbi:hypothetical protein LVJ94_39670 [Pendulispora rubella]|uniref:Uncharacterized protein n=1 Tax=Pendulispora rubella TaxID=2741070 RepID=A0ABZ2L1B1_9BACT
MKLRRINPIVPAPGALVQLARDQRGAGSIEYGLLLIAIMLVASTAFRALQNRVVRAAHDPGNPGGGVATNGAVGGPGTSGNGNVGGASYSPGGGSYNPGGGSYSVGGSSYNFGGGSSPGSGPGRGGGYPVRGGSGADGSGGTTKFGAVLGDGKWITSTQHDNGHMTYNVNGGTFNVVNNDQHNHYHDLPPGAGPNYQAPNTFNYVHGTTHTTHIYPDGTSTTTTSNVHTPNPWSKPADSYSVNVHGGEFNAVGGSNTNHFHGAHGQTPTYNEVLGNQHNYYYHSSPPNSGKGPKPSKKK